MHLYEFNFSICVIHRICVISEITCKIFPSVSICLYIIMIIMSPQELKYVSSECLQSRYVIQSNSVLSGILVINLAMCVSFTLINKF